MDKRTIKAIYWAVIMIELLCFYKWLIEPYGPVFLSLLQGNFEYDSANSLAEIISGIIRVTIQIFAFSFLFIGTTKLYNHIYASLPSNNSDNTDNR